MSAFDAMMQYGAVGDGVTDDAPAIQHAIDKAQAVGGTLRLPRPRVAYRLAEPLLVGTKFISEADVLSLTLNTLQWNERPSYSEVQYQASKNYKLINIEAEPGTILWADFEPEELTAVLYYGIPNWHTNLNFAGATIKGLTIVGKGGLSGSPPTRVETDVTTNVTNNLVGLCAPRGTVVAEGCYGRELEIGFMAHDAYWTTWRDCQTWHCQYGFVNLNANSTIAASNLAAHHSRSIGFIFSGQQFEVMQLGGQECKTSLWVPSAEQPHFTGTYFENHTDEEAYGVILGDPNVASTSTPRVRFATFRNLHVDHAGNNLIHLRDTYVTFDRCRAVRGAGESWLFDGSHNHAYLIDTEFEPVDNGNATKVVMVRTQNGEFDVATGVIRQGGVELP